MSYKKWKCLLSVVHLLTWSTTLTKVKDIIHFSSNSVKSFRRKWSASNAESIPVSSRLRVMRRDIHQRGSAQISEMYLWENFAGFGAVERCSGDGAIWPEWYTWMNKIDQWSFFLQTRQTMFIFLVCVILSMKIFTRSVEWNTIENI